MELTEEQREIIGHSDGHARVSAVAGSGKTTTMVFRLAHLLRQGVAADKIMVLMFNRSARESFEQAIRRRLSGTGFSFPEIRTFHSLGLRLVNSFTRRNALPARRLIVHDAVLEKLARQSATEAWRQLEGKWESLPKEHLEFFITFIDLVKSSVEDADTLYRTLRLDKKFSFLVPAFTLFEEYREAAAIRFYADLLSEPLQAMRYDSFLAQWVGNRVDHIIVDEYQDINECQQELLKIVAGERAEVMVVGDVDQCIYEWRGARPAYINKHFAQDFLNPLDYQLSYTFRYGHRLSLAANHLIVNNQQRDRKVCLSHSGNYATSLRCFAEGGDIHPVVVLLEEWQNRGRSLDEAVILVRLYAQSVPVEIALLSADIPYRLEGGGDIFASGEIMALFGYLRLLAGRLDELGSEELWQTLVAMLSQPYLGGRREELEELAREMAPLFTGSPQSALALLERGVARELPPYIKRYFVQAAVNWRWMLAQKKDEPAAVVLDRLVARLDLYEFYYSFAVRKVSAANRVKTCEAVINFARQRALTVSGLIDRFVEFQQRKKQFGKQTLLLTSIHRAKGLEWPLVILPGLEEGSFPFYPQKKEESDDLEDERRLFYVGITRAIEELVFVHPADEEFRQAKKEGKWCWSGKKTGASRFLFEANLGVSSHVGEALDEKRETVTVSGEDLSVVRCYLESVSQKMKVVFRQQQMLPKEKVADVVRRPLLLAELRQGMKVFHPIFGEGKVRQILDHRQGRITVDFPDEERVVLLVKFAGLEV